MSLLFGEKSHLCCKLIFYCALKKKKHISVPLLEEADEWSDSGAWANHDEGH